MFKYVLVGGKFDDNPKKSGYINKLFDAMMRINKLGVLYNGGTFDELIKIFSAVQEFTVIFWMPDVPNDKEKLVKDIKKECPHSLLITSKNNIKNKYSFLDLVAHALNLKSNLFIEFTKPNDLVLASIYDPLGNSYCQPSDDINLIAVTLMNRINKLLTFTRMNSTQTVETKLRPRIDDEFFELVKKYASVFHECMHSPNTTRMLGNASFRCESGFPSFKYNDCVFVSKRNIDKRDIGIDGFVQTWLDVGYNDLFNSIEELQVHYIDNCKPSVDTPIQLLLYRYYKSIRFMIHSHTYIQNAPFTHEIMPCGAIDEFYEIIKIFPDYTLTNIQLNLKGHGSIVMVRHLEDLKNIQYIPRIIPEI